MKHLEAKKFQCKTFSFIADPQEILEINKLIDQGLVDKSTHVNILLQRLAYDASCKYGYNTDTSIASSFSSEVAASWTSEAVNLSKSFKRRFKPKTIESIFYESYEPRIVHIITYILAASWLYNASLSKYRDACCIASKATWRPYKPVSKPPLNNPDTSSILYLLARCTKENNQLCTLRALNVVASGLLLWWARSFKQLSCTIICKMKSLPNHIAWKRGLLTRDQPRRTDPALCTLSPCRTALFLYNDIFRSLNANTLLNLLAEKNILLVNAGISENLVSNHIIPLKYARSVIPNKHSAIAEIYTGARFTSFLLYLAITIFLQLSRYQKIHGVCRRSLPVYLFSLLNGDAWDNYDCARMFTYRTQFLQENHIGRIFTSDVDTPDARMTILVAKRKGISTVSYPHGYFQYKRHDYMYLADKILVHGKLEKEFAASVGIRLKKISIIGGNFSDLSLTTKPPLYDSVIVLSNAATWAHMPHNFLYTTVSRLLELHKAQSFKVCLKLHPMVGDKLNWQILAQEWEADIIDQPWASSDFGCIKTAFFLGNPSSSILQIAQLKTIPAIIIPWNDHDKDLFGKYRLSFLNADHAMQAMLRANESQEYRLAMLSLLEKFYNDITNSGSIRSPEAEVRKLLLAA
jgi:hypothetical protein